MLNRKLKLQVLAAFAALLSLAFAASCKGFFVNSPDSLTISPDPVAFDNVGDSQQLSAQATFGTNAQDVTSSTIWKSSNGCAVVASTVTKGQMTVIGTGSSVTITATFNGVSDTVNATIPTGVTITPCGNLGKFSSGDTVTFTATAGGTDVTASTTWTPSNNQIVHFTSGSTATFGPNTGTAIITAKDGTDPDGHLQVTVQ